MINNLQLEIKSVRISKEYREKLKELFKEHKTLEQFYRKQRELNREINKVLNSIRTIKEDIKTNLDKTLTETDISDNLIKPSNSSIFFEVNHSFKTTVTISLETRLANYAKETDYDFIHKEYDYTFYLDKKKAIDEVGIKYDRKMVNKFIKNELQDIAVNLNNLEQSVTLGNKNSLYTGLIVTLDVIDESNLDFDILYKKLNNIVQILDSFF